MQQHTHHRGAGLDGTHLLQLPPLIGINDDTVGSSVSSMLETLLMMRAQRRLRRRVAIKHISRRHWPYICRFSKKAQLDLTGTHTHVLLPFMYFSHSCIHALRAWGDDMLFLFVCFLCFGLRLRLT